MKKLVSVFLFVLFIFACSNVLAITREDVSPLHINADVTLVDYGFCGITSSDSTYYGYILQEDERKDCEFKDPGMYIGVRNNTDSAKTFKFYIRGGKKYNYYWSFSMFIPAHETSYQNLWGCKKISDYFGNWSVDLTSDKKKNIVKFEMGAQ